MLKMVLTKFITILMNWQLFGKKSMQGIVDLIGASFNIKKIFNIIKEK